ncbi:MAG TPA: pilus assembly protein N-terminal domain-containing protein [Bryobacteraceae bacterium]|nr:pilus assembly protein N-terminal domain-containing protein [Bryobacteraceae bacterium]
MINLRKASAGGVFIGLLGMSFVSGAAPAQAPQQQEAPNDLFVNVGKSLIVDSARPIERVSVGLGEIAEATAVGPQEILLNGKAAGQTSLIIWQQGGEKLFFDVTVQPSRYSADSRLESLRRQMNRELPGQKIEPTIENDLIFVRGSAKDLTSADRAMAIASALGRAVNLLYVDVPPAAAQILLKVRFASVDRSRSEQLGMNLFSLGATNTIGSTTTGQFASIPGFNFQGFSTKGNQNVPARVQNYTLSNALNLFFFRPDLDLGATIQALETNNLLEILAEPNVLTEDGKQASFLAGGEFPYPVVQGGGTSAGTTAISIQFRQFGVRLNFIPTITPRGTIHLQVAPEVSALDYTNGVTLQGFTVPGVSVRNVNTEVELGEGQSFAIGGLLDNRETQTLEKIPFIGDVPILGKFFQSRQKNKTNTELIVIVTPQLVHPIPAGQPLPALHYPAPFLDPNTGKEMSTPGPNVTGTASPTPPVPNIPVESLIRSLQERQLVIGGTSGVFGSSTSMQSGGGGAPAPAPAPAPPATSPTP